MTNNIEKSRLRLELTLKNSSVCVWLLIGNRCSYTFVLGVARIDENSWHNIESDENRNLKKKIAVQETKQ